MSKFNYSSYNDEYEDFLNNITIPGLLRNPSYELSVLSMQPRLTFDNMIDHSLEERLISDQPMKR